MPQFTASEHPTKSSATKPDMFILSMNKVLN